MEASARINFYVILDRELVLLDKNKNVSKYLFKFTKTFSYSSIA